MLIFDSGEKSTQLIPIYEGYVLKDSIERSSLAG